MQLQLETTNTCHAACVFCAYPQMTRPKGTMPMPLFRRIIDDAATVPSIDLITLTGLGETLLDRYLVERVRYIRSVLPTMRIDLYTVGTHLRPALAEAVIDAGLSVLYVSLNGASRAQRQAVTTLDDYDTVVAQIQHARAYAAGKCRVIVKAVASKDLMEAGDTEDFQAQWDGPFETGGAAFLHLEGNWGGSTFKMRTIPTKACSRALGQIMVLWDGRVSLCCFDAHGDVILGDLTTQTLREMYAGDTALGIRTAHVEGRRNTLPLCATCTGI